MMSTGAASPSQPMPKPERRPRYAVGDLPFPHGGRHNQVWRKAFMPCLLAWAGSQDDPFGANSQMDSEIELIWQRIYPAIELDNQNFDILQNVVRPTLDDVEQFLILM
jgi:hypothetical protein